MIKRALISVSDKRDLIEFAKALKNLKVEIISTGETFKLLSLNNIEAIKVSDIIGFPEILDGRVKTLHPKIHGGILAIREKEDHIKTLKEFDIPLIDLVVVNLYPFKEVISKENADFEKAIENIDIGGVALIRAAAKNFKDVVILTNPEDYRSVLKEIEENKEVSYQTKLLLSYKAFSYTTHYDALISNYLKNYARTQDFPQTLTLTFEKSFELRYGENPHQKGAFYYQREKNIYGINDLEKISGKELSFNNINDINAALEMLREFGEPSAVAIKHTNPCGVGISDNINDAYKKAYEADPVSIFGGVVALNRNVNKELASLLNSIFLEIIIAPDFSPDGLGILKTKKNLRIMRFDITRLKNFEEGYDIKKVQGGILIQSKDNVVFEEEELKVVTLKKPSVEELKDLFFALKVVKHAKSNAIVIAKNGETSGIGLGAVSRIDACLMAIKKAGEKAKGALLASDAFFPFKDVVEKAADAGILGIIQPGGSIRDQESIDEADKRGISMVFTGIRHFKH